MSVLPRVLSRTLAVLLAAAVVVALVAPRNSWFVLPAGTVWVTTALLVALQVVARPLRRRLGRVVERRPRAAVLGGAVVGGAVVMVHLPLTVIDFRWDSRNVYWAAERFATGIDQTEMATEYFAKFPNNIPTLVMEGIIIKLGGPWWGCRPRAPS